MSSLHAKKMKKMECYTEVAVPYGVQKLSGVDLNVPKKKWFSLEESTPHMALCHWLCERFDKNAWDRDVIAWESTNSLRPVKKRWSWFKMYITRNPRSLCSGHRLNTIQSWILYVLQSSKLMNTTWHGISEGRTMRTCWWLGKVPTKKREQVTCMQNSLVLQSESYKHVPWGKTSKKPHEGHWEWPTMRVHVQYAGCTMKEN